MLAHLTKMESRNLLHVHPLFNHFDNYTQMNAQYLRNSYFIQDGGEDSKIINYIRENLAANREYSSAHQGRAVY